jgi:hypothetical protein
MDSNSTIALIDYPETDGQPMTESDPTRDYLKPQLKGARLIDGQYQYLPLQQIANGVSSAPSRSSSVKSDRLNRRTDRHDAKPAVG